MKKSMLILAVLMVLITPAFAHSTKVVAVVTGVEPIDADNVAFVVTATTGSFLILDNIRVSVSPLSSATAINNSIKDAVAAAVKADTPSLNYARQDVILASSVA